MSGGRPWAWRVALPAGALALVLGGGGGLGAAAVLGAGITLEAPRNPVPEGVAVALGLYAPEAAPGTATLFVRPVGATSCRPLSIDLGTDHRGVALIPEGLVTAPGLEYYAEIRTADGALTTDPPVYPSWSPHRLDVLASGSAGGLALLPPRGPVRQKFPPSKNGFLLFLRIDRPGMEFWVLSTPPARR